MPAIHYILRDGTTKTINASSGQSIMETAIMNNIRGIDAECGGCCSCATCHVYVEEKYLSLLPAPDEMEKELLEGVAAEIKSNSRLSCQLIINDELNNIHIHIPESQV